MKPPTALALFLLLAGTSPAEQARYQYRVTSYFIPERAEAIRKAFKEFHEGIAVVGMDFETATVTLRFDSEAVLGEAASRTDEHRRQALDRGLLHLTRGTINLLPPGNVPEERLKEVSIPIAGLDCIGCSYAAYEAVRRVEGVDYATASFRNGRVLARFDKERTSEDALRKALLKRRISLNYRIEGDNLVPPKETSIVRASSEDTGSLGFAKHAIDGDPQTKWESRWQGGITAQPPHELVIDLGKTRRITGFRYLARQLGEVGAFADTQFHVSESPDDFKGEPAARATFTNRKSSQAADCEKPVTGRYVLVRMLSEINGKPNGTAAEIGIVEAP